MDIEDNVGEAALMWACDSDRTEIVTLLLDAGQCALQH